MDNKLEKWKADTKRVLSDFAKQMEPKKGQIFVIGCSTSEISGEKIGTAGSLDAAKAVFKELKQFADQREIELAFQCCEHLNRALVVERKTLERAGLEEVTVIPVPEAGGSMAAVAYRNFSDPAVVENIKADFGMDIGDTLIGMHLKHVAVPVRVENPKIGNAHITLAWTRPKLIGGERAVYSIKKDDDC